MHTKSCTLCIHGLYAKGTMGSMWDQSEPDMTECQVMPEFSPEVFDQLDDDNVAWDEEKCPDICGRFEDIIKANCDQCGQTINAPVRTAEFTAYYYPDNDPAYLCGVECQTDFNLVQSNAQLEDEHHEKEAAEYWKSHPYAEDEFDIAASNFQVTKRYS